MKLNQNKFELSNDGIWVSKVRPETSYSQDCAENSFHVEENSFWFKHRNEVILSAFKRFIKKKSIVDIGGGNGFVSKFFQDNQVESILVEPEYYSSLNAKVSREINNVICSTFEDSIFEDNTIEAAGAFDVVEHIENDAEFILKISKIIKVGGYLILTVPAYNFLWSNEDVFAGHFRRYTRGSIKKLLKQNQFQPVTCSYFFSFLIFPIFFFRALPRRFGRKFEVSKEKVKKNHDFNKKRTQSFMINLLCSVEMKMISFFGFLPFGSSIVVVARRVENND